MQRNAQKVRIPCLFPKTSLILLHIPHALHSAAAVLPTVSSISSISAAADASSQETAVKKAADWLRKIPFQISMNINTTAFSIL